MLVLGCCIAVSCTKTEVPQKADPADLPGEPIPAKEFEEAMLETLATLNLDFNFFFVRHVFSEIALRDPAGLLGPIAEQMMKGQLLPTGHFTTVDSTWTYSEADDFRLTISDGVMDDNGFIISYNGSNKFFPRLPESVDFSMFYADSTLARTSAITTVDSTGGVWKAGISLRMETKEEGLIYLTWTFGRGSERGLVLGLGNRIKFIADPLLVPEALLRYYVIDKFYRNTDRLEAAIDDFNGRYAVPFYLDGAGCGNLELEMFEEEGDIFADFVLRYPSEGTSYCIQPEYFLE